MFCYMLLTESEEHLAYSFNIKKKKRTKCKLTSISYKSEILNELIFISKYAYFLITPNMQFHDGV